MFMLANALQLRHCKALTITLQYKYRDQFSLLTSCVLACLLLLLLLLLL